jgi:hypothetical protein
MSTVLDALTQNKINSWLFVIYDTDTKAKIQLLLDEN